MSKPVVGAQLFSLRKYCQDTAGLRDTMKRVRGIGYTTVQVSGIGQGIEPAAVAEAAEAAGVRIVATHVGWPRFLQDLDAVIAEHQQWRCPHAAIGGLPGDYFTAAGVDRFLAELKPVAKRLAAAGIDFSYHNHHHELIRYGGRPWLDQLYTKAPASLLKAEIDTYWITAGGGSPEAWIRRCAGRIPLLHLKDMCIVAGNEQRFAEIGEGNLDWDGILAAAVEAGTEYLLVEQDNCYDRDPLESMAISYRNLKAMGWE